MSSSSKTCKIPEFRTEVFLFQTRSKQSVEDFLLQGSRSKFHLKGRLTIFSFNS